MARLPHIKPTLRNGLPTRSYLIKLSKQLHADINAPKANAGVSLITWSHRHETRIRLLIGRLEKEGFTITGYKPLRIKEPDSGNFTIEKVTQEQIQTKNKAARKSKAKKTKTCKKKSPNVSQDLEPESVNQGGRPAYKVDYKVLDSLCAIFCTGEECASILGVSYETLNTALKRETDEGFLEYFKTKSAHGKMALRRAQFKRATGGNTAMLIWMGKQHLEQLEYTKPNYEAAHPAKPEEENNAELTPQELEKFAKWFDKNY